MAAAAPKLHPHNLHGIYRFSVLECSPRALCGCRVLGLKLREWTQATRRKNMQHQAQKQTWCNSHSLKVDWSQTTSTHKRQHTAAALFLHATHATSSLELSHFATRLRIAIRGTHNHNAYHFSVQITYHPQIAAAAAQWSDPLLWACICVNAAAKPNLAAAASRMQHVAASASCLRCSPK